jgi:ADP-ribose pyrophosphatase YjhB (NUDIX family)
MPENKKWKKEIAAGGIVFKKENAKTFILLVMPKGHNYGPPVGYWTFPKGLADSEDDDMKITALREVKEEAGVEGEIVKELGYVTFFRGSSSGYDPVFKIVHYYLMKYIIGDITQHDKEVAEVSWFELEEVPSKLKFKHDKEIYERALKVLQDNHPDRSGGIPQPSVSG